MIHIITYQSIRGNTVTKSFNDFASALKLITTLENANYTFLYNSMQASLSHETTEDSCNYRCSTKRENAIKAQTKSAFLSCNNQTRLRNRWSFVDPSRDDLDEAIAGLIFEKQLV